MRLVGIASIVFVLALTFVMSGFGPAVTAQQFAGQSREDRERTGQAIFRYDTFGDEQLWTDVLRMHEVIATVDPLTALARMRTSRYPVFGKELFGACSATSKGRK